MSKAIEHRIGLKDQFTPGLAKIRNSTIKYRSSLNDLKTTASNTWSTMRTGLSYVAGAVGLAGTASIAGFGAMINSVADAGREVDKLAQMMGMSNVEFQKWDYALKRIGYSGEQATGDLAALAEKAWDASQGVGEGAELFRALGVSVVDSTGKLRTQGQIFDDVVTSLQGMEDITRRNAIASALLSTTGEELVPILNMTAKELSNIKNNAVIIDDKTIQNSVELSNSMKDLKSGIGGVMASLISPALPAFNEGVQWLVNKLPEIEAFSRNAFGTLKQTVEDGRNAFETFKPVIYGVAGGLIAYKAAMIAANVWTVAKTTSLKLLATWTTFYGNASAASAGKVGILTLAQRGLNAAMKANPIGFVITLISMLVTSIIYLVKNWEQVKLVGMNTWNILVGVTQWAVNAYITYLNFMLRVFIFVWDSIEFAGKSVWNGILRAGESGVNSFIGLINGMVDSALGGINTLIKGANKVSSALGFGDVVKEITFSGIKKVDFSGAMADIEKPKWDSEFNLIPKVDMSGAKFSDDQIVQQANKAQAEKNKRKTEEELKQDDLIKALNNNTEVTKGNTSATKANTKATLKDKSSTAIADTLVSRIEREIWGTT